jgi:hypothetical protein
MAEFTEQASAMAGDVISNLRSTLDHLTWQLACRHTDGKPRWPRRVQFPIEDNPTKFPQRCSDCSGAGWLYEVSPTDQAKIELFQPYRGVDGQPDTWSGPYIHPLALLRNLSDTHKHRNLTTILLIPNSASFMVGIDSHSIAEFMVGQTKAGIPLDNALDINAQVMGARVIGEVEPHVEMAGYATPSVALDEKRPIIPTLDRIAAYVVRILRKFDPVP